MADLNIVAVVGRLVKNCELRYSQNGLAIANFTLAVNKRKKAPDGNYEEVASFFDCAYFGKAAEGVSQYLTKGQQVSIQGSLEQQRWETDGQKRSKVVISVYSLGLLGGSKQGNQPQNNYNQQNTPSNQNRQPQGQYQGQQQNYGKAPEDFIGDDFEETIPF